MEENKTLENKVFEALGEVSTCWIPNTGNAVFDSTKATEVGNRLMKEIKEKYEQPYLIDVNLIPKDFDINKFKELMRNIPLQVVQSKPSLEEAIEVLCNALKDRDLFEDNGLKPQMLTTKKLEILKTIANLMRIDWDIVEENGKIISLNLKPIIK